MGPSLAVGSVRGVRCADVDVVHDPLPGAGVLSSFVPGDEKVGGAMRLHTPTTQDDRDNTFAVIKHVSDR